MEWKRGGAVTMGAELSGPLSDSERERLEMDAATLTLNADPLLVHIGQAVLRLLKERDADIAGERERCAKIAERVISNPPKPGGVVVPPEFFNGGSCAADEIARCIREPR